MTTDGLFFADRSERGKLRFTGEQRAWFLHQILTQAFEDIAVGETRDTAMTTAQGRLTGYLEAMATEDAIFCHFEEPLAAILPDEIRRYVFATQVDIDDLTDEMGMILVGGEGWRAAVDQLDGVHLVQPTRSLGVDAAYIWAPRDDVPELLVRVKDADFEQGSEESLEAMRIAAKLPRWGFEMDEKTFPQEVGIDAWAVDYDKGCYLGQEAMAKIHFRGKVNRRLTRVSGDDVLARGTDLFAGEAKIGRISSAAGKNGLALVRHDVVAGTSAIAGCTRATVLD
jgi:folate-binding protein YgfZ